MNEITLSGKFHEGTKLLSMEAGGEGDMSDARGLWGKVHFKSYARFRQVALIDEASSRGLSLEHAILARRSRRDFQRHPVLLEELSKILHYSAGITHAGDAWDESRRAYPSAGARYPLECYPVVLESNDIDPGIYHHNVKRDTLELLRVGCFREQMIHLTGQEWVGTASVVLLISAVFGRTQSKYGDRGYRYVFLDAGHMAQNVYTIATSINLGCCTIAGFLDHEVDEMLDLDGNDESVIYMAVIGRC